MAFKAIELPSTGITQQQLPQFQAPAEETYGQKLGRSIPALGATALESAIGLPRATAEFAQSIGNIAFRGTRETAPDYPLGTSVPFLPTAETAREWITGPLAKAITGKEGYLEPQTPAEEKAHSVVSAAVPFFFSGGRSLVQNVARGLGISGAGHLVEFAGQKIGLPDPFPGILKMGTMFGASLIGKPSAKKTAAEIYDTNTEAIPEQSLTTARPVQKEIENIRKYTKTGDTTTPSKEFLRNFIDKVENKISQDPFLPPDSIRVRDLPQLQKDYNEWFSEGKVPRRATSYMNRLFKSFDAAVEKAPKAARVPYENLETGRDIYRAIHAGNKIEEFIKNSPKISALIKKGGPLGTAFAIVSKPLATGVASGIGLLTYGAYDVIDKAARFPGMRFYYGKLLSSLLKEDTVAAINAANKVAQYFKSEKEEPIKRTGKFKVVSA